MLRFDLTDDGGIVLVTDRLRADLNLNGWMDIIPALNDALADENRLRRCPIDDSVDGLNRLHEQLETIDPPAAEALANALALREGSLG